LNHGARTTRALSALSQTIAQRAFHTVDNEVFLNHATIHPVWVRAFHWINAAAVILMCMSGWEVYEASPIFGTIRFPAAITLGG
jgi:thiosulfate reductase cytochrome b subunit